MPYSHHPSRRGAVCMCACASRGGDTTFETPYGSSSVARDSGIQIPQLTLSRSVGSRPSCVLLSASSFSKRFLLTRRCSVKAQVKIQEEDELAVHHPASSASEPHSYTPHMSTAPQTFLPISAAVPAISYDDILHKEGFKNVTSNGNASLVPDSLAANRTVIRHTGSSLIDVGGDATVSGKRLGQPWVESGKLNGDYVTNKGRLTVQAMSYQDKPTARTETMLQADEDAEKLHAARILHNNAPIDFKTILNDNEHIVMQIKCKGIQGLPGGGGDIVGDCWLILVRMTFGDDEVRRIYFYQSAHVSKGYELQDVTQDHRCLCCVAQDSTLKMTATRTETAYLDMLTVEDHLVHANYEQMKRTAVEKVSQARGKYLRPACVRDCAANCPSCSLDLCQGAENDHCTVPLCCCVSCVVPSMCRPGYAKLVSASGPPESINEVVTRVSSLKTERYEDSVGPGDFPMILNRMESTNVQQADFYAISMQFAFPNRSMLKECLAIMCPTEPVSKALKFVMLISQKPTLLDCPAGAESEFRVIRSKDNARLRRDARGGESLAHARTHARTLARLLARAHTHPPTHPNTHTHTHTHCTRTHTPPNMHRKAPLHAYFAPQANNSVDTEF